MFIKNLKTKNFFWAKHKEYIIDETDIIVSNKNTGLQNTSLHLKKGEYTLIITKEQRIFFPEQVIESFKGKLKLSGTEENNEFLEKNSTGHVRKYIISNKYLNLFLSEIFLKENNLKKDEDYFLYLKFN